MAVTATVTDHWEDGKRVHVIGTLAFSGSYATGGDTVTVSNLPLIKSASPPNWAEALGQSKYKYIFILSGKVKIITPDTGAELAAGAYSATITQDTVLFYAIFPKHI
jgi:hypothetical protein